MIFDKLTYNIMGETVVCILSFVFCINILMSFSPQERRHRIFLYAGIGSLLTTLFDILAVFCISFYKTIPLWWGTLSSTIFFLFLLSEPCMLTIYSAEVALSYRKTKKIAYIISLSVYFIYILIILLNLKTGWVFRYDSQEGYIRGPLKSITYITTFVLGFENFAILIRNRKYMAIRLYIVLLVFPILSMLILLIQFFIPTVVVTGASTFAALLIIYVTIQSDMLEFDLGTGLMTGHKLKSHIEQSNLEGVLFLLSIDNINFIQDHTSPEELNQLFLNIGKEFSKRFQRRSYHISTNRFAGICATNDEAVRYQQEIRKYIDNINSGSEFNLPGSLEVYYAAMPFQKGDKSYSDVMSIINNLLNKAKNHNDYQLQLCNNTVLLEMERKRIIFDILKEELRPDSTQFQVWFQPIYSLKEKRFTYMEALSRLQNTRIGNIPPGEFVEIAESKGLIEKLGFVAFEKICQFISENRELVRAVSVNFSVYQMTTPDCVDNVLSVIKRYNLEPSRIIMEITESIFIDNYDVVLGNMYKLSQAGIQFYLDDFGSGYSNLSNVVGLPFSTIKIDRSLVLMMDESEKNIRLFKNLVTTFKDANLKILVEGVETEEQSTIVNESGADYIQGFLFSRPLPPEKCIELLKKEKEILQ